MAVEEISALVIEPLNQEAIEESIRHWNGIAKPIDGLGKLEELVAKIAGITGKADVNLGKKAVLVMCADNGILEERVTQSDNSVTAIVSANMAKGIASVNRMAAVANAEVIPIDIGIARDIEVPGLRNHKIAYGTRNFAKEPAMTKEEVWSAIHLGMELVRTLKEEGYGILATGEMGIGNTSTSSAMTSALLGISAEKVTGKGAGLDQEGVLRKKEVIRKAIEKYQLKKEQTIEILCTFGGLDIAGLTGVFIGGACYHIPIVIDGVISEVAALTATRLFPEIKPYLIASHISKEPGAIAIIEELGLDPMIHGNLALGEGTGAVLLFPMLEMALSVYRENVTFEDNKTPAYVKYE